MARRAVTIETRDGTAPATVFTPDAGGAPWPAVLVYMDGRGIRPALFELAVRIAKAGYYVLLPDLFYRAGPYVSPGPRVFLDDPEARKQWFAKYMSTATHANIKEDTRAFLDFLAQEREVSSPLIGTTGYCLGGGLSLSAAGNFPDRIVAAASYHGGNLATEAPDSPHLLASRIRGHVYVAGAIEDSSFPDEQRRRLEKALSDARVDHKVETYQGARHGWVPSDSPVHNEAAAERHFDTLLALFEKHLKPAANKQSVQATA